jgi:glycogen phosphorylase
LIATLENFKISVPLVAVGFMYPEGYLRQQIREDGWQENLVGAIDREAAPISRVMGEDGRQLVVKIPLTDPPFYIAMWKVEVGRVLISTGLIPRSSAAR